MEEAQQLHWPSGEQRKTCVTGFSLGLQEGPLSVPVAGSTFFGCISTHGWLQLHIMQCCRRSGLLCCTRGLCITNFLVAQVAWLLVPLQWDPTCAGTL